MTDTKAPTVQVYRIHIRATPEAIWTAITDPEWTERYGYGGRGEFDLQPGGSYRGLTSEAMRAHGAPEGAIEGEVIEADPPRKLVLTWSMLMDPVMAAEQPTRLTYELDPAGEGITRLTVVHELADAPNTASLMAREMEDHGAGGGWSWVLSDLKTLLETGRGFNG
jgi:uncharacterized protein YndB with AHSA1/START domain